jgi:hypothetical protein
MNTFRVMKLSVFLLVTIVAASVPALAQGPIVSCNSNDMNRHYCDIGPNDGVRVARQHSNAACIEGRTYGVRGSQMWVDRGCRAEFEVIPDRRGRNDRWNHDDSRDRDDRDHGYPYRGDDHDRWDHDRSDHHPASSSTVYCASDNMRRNFCGVGPSRSIRLVRKRSDAACDMNRTYGFDRNGIWVDRGCRADFEVIK